MNNCRNDHHTNTKTHLLEKYTYLYTSPGSCQVVSREGEVGFEEEVEGEVGFGEEVEGWRVEKKAATRAVETVEETEGKSHTHVCQVLTHSDPAATSVVDHTYDSRYNNIGAHRW